MATKPASLAVITLDSIHHYLLPADRALKIVALLEGAVTVNRDYESRNFQRDDWVIERETEIGYASVKTGAVRTASGEAHTSQSRRGDRSAIQGNATRLLTGGGDQ